MDDPYNRAKRIKDLVHSWAINGEITAQAFRTEWDLKNVFREAADIIDSIEDFEVPPKG
jgi:hypothetical protein